jgi:hypothetical protein
MPEFVAQGVNTQRSIFSASASATFTSGPFVNPNSRSAIITLNITAVTGTTPTLAVKFQGVNHDGVAWDLPGVAFSSQNAVAGPLVLLVSPGLTAGAGIVNGLFPVQYQVVHTIGGTTPVFTYTLDIDLLP